MNRITMGLAALSVCAAATLAPAAAWAGDAAADALTFSYVQSYSDSSPQTATGGTGTIDFTGSMTTGTPCYTLTAGERQRRNTITVTVTAASSGGICSQVITHNNYQGQVSGLAAGTYQFSVVHVVNGQRTTAYSATVQVQ